MIIFLYNEMKLYSDKRPLWMKHLDVKIKYIVQWWRRKTTYAPIRDRQNTGRKVNGINRSLRHSLGLSLINYMIRSILSPLNKIELWNVLLSWASAWLWPAPNLANPSGHMHFLLHNIDDPRMFKHILWWRTRSRINYEPKDTLAFCKAFFWEVTNVWDIKSFISSDHRTPGSSSSRGG